jgi:hypothetical protein
LTPSCNAQNKVERFFLLITVFGFSKKLKTISKSLPTPSIVATVVRLSIVVNISLSVISNAVKF